MDINKPELREELTDALRPVFFLVIGVVAVSVVFLVQGVEMVDASGTCYTRTVTCHGVTAGGSCMGYKAEDVDYVEKSSCQQIDQIKNLCGKVKEAVCKAGTSDWMDQGVVFGKGCDEWNRVYDLGMTSCQQ